MITDHGILPRYCTCCKQLKLASNFSTQTAASGKRYLASTCKQCRVAATKKWMSKPENRARHNKWRRENYSLLKNKKKSAAVIRFRKGSTSILAESLTDARLGMMDSGEGSWEPDNKWEFPSKNAAPTK